MVMTLVDLEFELDLFLFNTGFTRFWKMTEGTVIAILNPNVMPPPPGRQDTGRFSLVISSDEDTIIEVGSARDLGFCQSVKKDGQLCMAWVNKKKTQFCEFHSNAAVSKQRASRMEVNSFGFGSGGQRRHNQREVNLDQYKAKKTSSYDADTGTHWFVSRSHSAADLIDGKDRAPADRKERAEFVKRGLEAKEKEREMMKKLGRIGSAAGKEYMQRVGSRASDALSLVYQVKLWTQAPQHSKRNPKLTHIPWACWAKNMLFTLVLSNANVPKAGRPTRGRFLVVLRLG